MSLGLFHGLVKANRSSEHRVSTNENGFVATPMVNIFGNIDNRNLEEAGPAMDTTEERVCNRNERRVYIRP